MIINGVAKIELVLQKWINGMVSFPNNAEADALLENQLDNLLEMETKWSKKTLEDE
jgi:hypothetical protein